jgi:hypothetical protein
MKEPHILYVREGKIFGLKFGNIMGEVLYSEYLTPPLPLPVSGRGKVSKK